MCAAEYCHVDCARLLLDAGADIHAKNKVHVGRNGAVFTLYTTLCALAVLLCFLPFFDFQPLLLSPFLFLSAIVAFKLVSVAQCVAHYSHYIHISAVHYYLFQLAY